MRSTRALGRREEPGERYQEHSSRESCRGAIGPDQQAKRQSTLSGLVAKLFSQFSMDQAVIAVAHLIRQIMMVEVCQCSSENRSPRGGMLGCQELLMDTDRGQSDSS